MVVFRVVAAWAAVDGPLLDDWAASAAVFVAHQPAPTPRQAITAPLATTERKDQGRCGDEMDI